MKIVIPGGSGQVGTILAGAFHRGGHELVVLSRQPQRPATDCAAHSICAVTPGRPRSNVCRMTNG